MNTWFYKIALIVILLFSSSITGASAHIGATGIVKERMDTMSAMGQALGIILDMIKGKTEFDIELALQSANILHDHSIDAANQYPNPTLGNDGEASKAMSIIWKERVEFNRLLNNLQDESKKLIQIIAMNNLTLVRTQFLKVAKTCSACHEKFRNPN